MPDTSFPSKPQGLSEALEYAALSGPFDPRKALERISRTTREQAAEVASALAAVCDTNPDRTNHWLMLGGDRHQVLRHLRNAGRLQDAVERRRLVDLDATTNDLLNAIMGAEGFTEQHVRSAIDTASRDVLVRLATALDWAGDVAVAASLLEPSRTAIKRLERQERRRALQELPFVGRTSEIDRLISLLDGSARREIRGVFLSGPPGIGKSALVEQVILRHVDDSGSVVVRLDFDRAGLDVTDLRVLTMEAARKIADRIGEKADGLLRERLRTAGLQEGSETILETRRIFPERLAVSIAQTLRDSSRPLLVVVDTLEALQARGSTHLDQLFDWLQRLSEAGVVQMRVLVAGRASPPKDFRRVVGEPVVLEGLSRSEALEFTARLQVEVSARETVIDRAAGVPLAIKLAADIVAADGVDALPSTRLNPKLASALLYRILLSRIEDDVLRDLAHPGLIVRRINVDLLRDVIAPAVGLVTIDNDRARELFDALARQHWLVEPDPRDPNFVRHRGDIRRDLLPLLYGDKPALCGRVDREAVKWFAAREDQESAVDALYHRLQLLRRSPTRPAIPETLASLFDDAMLDELPENARVLVRQVVGSYGGAARVSAMRSSGDDDRIVRELVNIVSKSDWAEGRALVERVERIGSIDPKSRLADAVRAFWWRAGQWYDANWLLRERDRMGATDDDIPHLEPTLAVARLEMRGEYGRAAEILRDPQRLLDRTPLRSKGTELARYGGLAFRIARASPQPLPQLESGETPDPVASAFARWSGCGIGQWDQHAVDYAARRLQSVGAMPSASMPPWVETQMLTSLTPYASLAVNLSQNDRRLSDHARVAAAILLAGSRSPLSMADGISVPSEAHLELEPITAIANAGLFAEWAEALGYALEHPNLRSIGRAADNWRQTMAGAWRYGPGRPRGWERREVDEVLDARIKFLRSSGDPYAHSLSQLSAWIPDFGSEEAVWDVVRQRSAGAIASASEAFRAVGYQASVIKLRQYKVPAAFVPSIVVLIEASQQ